jgi:hypothetical protein
MANERIIRLRIALEDWEPEIWRLVEVPARASLKTLHDVIQVAMGWQDYHLWEFEGLDRRYGLPDPEWPDDELVAAKDVTLATLVDGGVSELTYTYYMGDDWRHIVTVAEDAPAEPGRTYPRLLDGARRCPPEDVGGLPGFDHFLEALADPRHEEHAHLVKWNGGSFDEENFESAASERRVAAVACGWRKR